MLKWTVINKRQTTPGDLYNRRHSVDLLLDNSRDQAIQRPKRRRSSAGGTRRQHKRLSLNTNFNKENQYSTSTPIKSDDCFHSEALRDVSNITPKENKMAPATKILTGSHKKLLSPKHVKHKKKKRCVDPAHAQIFSFGALDENCGCKIFDEKSSTPNRITDTYAPTLPTFAMEYSPCSLRTTHNLLTLNSNSDMKKLPYLLSRMKEKEEDLNCPPFKKPKIDHVNDFLHQISFLTSPDKRFKEMEVKVSPLVKKMIDLRFTNTKEKNNLNNSSFINNLSLNELVNVILDNTLDNGESAEYKNKESFSDKTSSDSGFRSNPDSHNIDSNFMCVCKNTDLKTQVPVISCDKTIININETYNERCVDQDVNAKKQNSPRMERMEDINDCTLKRQRGIRRRKLADDLNNLNNAKNCNYQRNNTFNFTNYELLDNLNDNSFESSLYETSDGIGSSKKNSKCENCDSDEDCHTNIRRTRRCLLFDSPASDNSSTNSSLNRYSVSGSMELEISCNSNELVLRVVRCQDLARSRSKPVNAYIKVSLMDGRKKQQGTLQRTAVQAESTKPMFNHTFRLPLLKTDLQKRLFVEVWHRDRICRRSKFLGCMSFNIKNIVKKNIKGQFHLLPQSTGRCQNVPMTSDHIQNTSETSRTLLQQQDNNFFCDQSTVRRSSSIKKMLCDINSSVDDIIMANAIALTDDIDADLKKSSVTNKAALSEQQKLADENLFLRYLELDPTEGPDAIPAALQRKATGNKNGRTPFTTTKKLSRQPKTGFGFSVVWTHPPRVERVEKGLPADRAGIVPGDYIIFVDKHNVVMMPEIEILHLIRSYGNQLTLEIFRRNASKNGSVPNERCLTSVGTESTMTLALQAPPSLSTQRRPSTICSTINTTSADYNRRKLQLPQVTFSAEKPTNSIEDARRKAMYQIITKEQQYATGLQFAVTRFVSALAERKDLITPREHKLLFQNSDELLHISEDIIDILLPEEGEPQFHLLPSTYNTKLNEITTAYKKYCSGIKKSDCILANKTKNCNSEFVRFLQCPAIPRRRPDITVFIHKPLEHFRDVLKLFSVILSNTKSNFEDYPVISHIVHELQTAYREITAEGGLMEPLGEGRPLLSVQDLENRLVFTKCKPFVLSKPGRHWIFGGDLSRVEGRNVRQYWALLFTDILLFAKVSRDRVLFIFEEPLSLAHITDLMFNVRKKINEFRITVEPGGKMASSPTVHCGPDLTRTPRKNPNRRCVVLRAPTTELKAVWQNLLQRQIFHVNAGMEGSSFSSPLESPEAPITSSVATLQSAESLSIRRQNISAQSVNTTERTDEIRKHIDELIEHKCKQLGKSNSGQKGGAIHLEQWMKGQLGAVITTTEQDTVTPDDEHEFELWTEEMLRKRSEELQLMISNNEKGPNATNTENVRCESRIEEIIISDIDYSPSRSTTSESQVTVRSSPVVPETLTVCKQCHRTCLTNQNGSIFASNNNTNTRTITNNNRDDNANNRNSINDKNNLENDDDWRPLMLMGLSAINPAATLIKLDPFSAPVPKISIVPPTPDCTRKISNDDDSFKDTNCNCHESTKDNGYVMNDNDNSPDSSPQTEDQPYHSLNSSNLTLRRYGTVSSLERLGPDEVHNEENEDSDDENCDHDANSSPSEDDDDDDDLYEDDDIDDEDDNKGYYNEGFNNSSVKSWTARAGSFVAEKMSFFERLGEDYKAGSRFFERYLRSTEVQMNGEEGQEEETSGATSGEDVWGTPTSGGELDDPLSSPNHDGRKSPNDDSISSNDDNTELMMDELLMTPPVTSSSIRGLLPRRTLEPLLEEEYSDTYTSSSSSSSDGTHTDPSGSPEQGNGIGNVADVCSTAAENPDHQTTSFERSDITRTPTPTWVASRSVVPRANDTQVVNSQVSCNSTAVVVHQVPKIHRSESYRHIIEAEDEHPRVSQQAPVTLFTRLRPTTIKFVNIEKIPRSKGVKLLEFFNMKRERKIHEAFGTSGKHLIKMYTKDEIFSDDIPMSYADKPLSPRRLKDKQLDRRFWKQLNKRRGHKPLQLSA